MVTIAVIEIGHRDLQELLGEDVSIERLEKDGSMLGILFEDSEKEDVIEVEVEPNRPDLLSAEGIARALRGFFDITPGAVDYPVKKGNVTVEVEESVEDVRPYIACARITDLDLDTAALNSLIQLQEKLTQTYGRKRAKVAIGLHDFSEIRGPITYKGVEPDALTFQPLGMDDELTPAEILKKHEKGQEYGYIIEDAERYPLIVDTNGIIVSMPPVINGVATEVTEATDDLFLDVTGTSQHEVETALNILVAALHERGGHIESVTVEEQRYPDMSRKNEQLDPAYVRKISGLNDLSADGMRDVLERMNYTVHTGGDALTVEVPAYRADIMQSYDIIEDIVIGYGYDDIEPAIPDISTIGGQSDERVLTDKLREYMIGAGAQELMTFILSNTEKLFDRMELDEENIVEMANPLTEDYAVVRHWMLPSMLEVFSDNQHNRYPQTVFEVGTCARLDTDTHTGAADFKKLVYAEAANDVTFTDARSVLQALAKQLGVDVEVTEYEHASFVDKRCGQIVMNGTTVGVIGEVSEQVRKNWDLDEVNVAAFELDVEKLQKLV